jgi:cytochrome c peroxidase
MEAVLHKLLYAAIIMISGTYLFAEDAYPIPLGLPTLPWPEDNPYTKEKAELGRLLYFDKRLSSDGSVACATCHAIDKAFTDNKPVSEGILGHKGSRNAPTVINSGYERLLFWDGRAASLEEQCKGPLANVKEMTSAATARDAHLECERRVKHIHGYQPLFKAAFGNDDCSIDDIAKAIATYERTVLSGESPYDLYMTGKDKTKMSEEALRGLAVFRKSGCANCHAGPLFSDGRFLNIGVGMDAADPDLGRYAITHDPKDWGAFKVPTLREIEYTAPYMHDGSLNTLEDVVDYYDRGGNANRNLHPLLQKPLHLSESDKKALVTFMKTLHGRGWEHLTEPSSFPE